MRAEAGLAGDEGTLTGACRSRFTGNTTVAEFAGHVVCTLAEGGYFYGVAALINSLVRADFEGLVLIGYRGARPAWLRSLGHNVVEDIYEVTPGVRVKLIEMTGTWHLNNCKPLLLRSVLFELCPKAELVYYLDTDIVVKHSWNVFAQWARSGIVLVLDIADSHMSPHHVYRHAWRTLAARQGFSCREFTGYVNAGCVGISRDHAEFATIWTRLMDELERDGVDMRKMKNQNGRLEFARMDQDVLNATIMASQTPLALLGFEAMGLFPWWGMVMPHAMYGKKPWVRNYIADALRGWPPGQVHNAYWEFASYPIRPFHSVALRVKRLELAIGNLIGRLHMRSFRDL
jgi:hypothetical protein